jgi:hypothetical protein
MDDVDLILQLEEFFGISMQDDRVTQIINVGDMFDYLVELSDGNDERRKACFSAVCYYRLCQALRSMGSAELDLKPSTGLSGLLDRLRGSRSIKDVWAELGERAEATLPSLSLGFTPGFPWVGSVLPEDEMSLGDLARQAGGWSYPGLSSEFGQRHRSDLWHAFIQQIGWMTGRDDLSLIGRETTFFD